MWREVSLWILVSVILCSNYSTAAVINTDTILGCLPREYKFNASKTFMSNGQTLSCWDIVTVYSCWGRCDSFEVIYCVIKAHKSTQKKKLFLINESKENNDC